MSCPDLIVMVDRASHLPRPENSVVQSSSLKIAQLASQCCSRGQVVCSAATVPASVHFTVACVVYCLNDPVSASCEIFVVSLVVASRLATVFLTGNYMFLPVFNRCLASE